jgi:hypothetical protein
MAEAQIAQLAEELEKVRGILKTQEDAIKNQDKGDDRKPLVILPSQRLDKFRGPPEKSTDPSVREWVADVRATAEIRKLTDADFSSLILSHLGGKARQEIAGRGDDVKKKPEDILAILLNVFGDLDQRLPVLQQRFYAYQQEGEDILTCSLTLVEIYDRIIELDAGFKNAREQSLKGRFAEAVKDETLRRELRRLNEEQSTLPFFELRDRAVRWVGASGQAAPKHRTVNEIAAGGATEELTQTLKRQSEMLEQQQRQINELLQAKRNYGGRNRWNDGNQVSRDRGSRNERRCWNCQSLEHLKRDCPQNAPNPEQELNP